MSRPPILLLPIEIHSLWMDYLDQPDLLRVAGASKRFRAIVSKRKDFYICLRLFSVREDARAFMRGLVAARPLGVQLVVSIDLPYALSRHSRSIFESRISTELERSMHLVRSLSIFLAVPLVPEFLLYPAPALRQFRFHIDTTSEGYPDSDPYSSSDSDASSDSGLGFGSDEAHAITHELFSGAAPMLTSVNLTGTKLPDGQVPAFSRVTRVRLAKVYTAGQIPLDLGVIFPSAQVMKLAGTSIFTTSSQIATAPRRFPRGIVRLYLEETDLVLARLLRVWDLTGVPHLHLNYGTTSAYDWLPFLTHVSAPTRLRVAVHLPKRTASKGLHLTATLSSESPPDRDRTLTFYAELGDDAFHEVNAFSQLGRHAACGGLAWIELPRHFVVILFVLGGGNALPALRRLRIVLDGLAGGPFWTREDGDGLPLPGPHWPALATLELASELRAAMLPSRQLAAFATALGLRDRSPDRLPELVLDNVVITRGTDHQSLFSRCRTA